MLKAETLLFLVRRNGLSLLLFAFSLVLGKDYYGSSTYGRCKEDSDCIISGCNAEVCQSRREGSIFSPCVLPSKPTPKQLNYRCKCVEEKCQWWKNDQGGREVEQTEEKVRFFCP
ncbi:eight-cysteine-cluster domain-containing protein [Thermocrinis sp.]